MRGSCSRVGVGTLRCTDGGMRPMSAGSCSCRAACPHGTRGTSDHLAYDRRPRLSGDLSCDRSDPPPSVVGSVRVDCSCARLRLWELPIDLGRGRGGVTLLWRHGQLREQGLTVAFPLRNTASSEVVNIRGCVQERHRQWCSSSCTTVEVLM